jgi:hemerythrin
MTKIEWNAGLEIGIPVIDGQHRRIVDYLNALADPQTRGERGGVDDVIACLLDYTESHFAFEEALMEEVGYDAVSIHRETHRAFSARVATLRHRHEQGEQVGDEVAELLRRWLLDHIVRDDRDYATVVRARLAGLDQDAQGGWLKKTLRRCFGP